MKIFYSTCQIGPVTIWCELWVVEIPDVTRCCAESVSLVADQLGLVVDAFDGAIMDAHSQVVPQVFLVATQHPGELAHGL